MSFDKPSSECGADTTEGKMQGLSFLSREKKWGLYHKFELEIKRRFLDRLSQQDSLNILRDLHRCVYNSGRGPDFSALGRDKIKHLAKIHALFSRVKL
jgi:hypothetical protein